MNTYTTRATAVRGALRMGMITGAFCIEREDDGRFAIHSTPTDVVFADEPTSPVAFMWAFIDAHPEMSRKEQTRALKALGRFNEATVNTQVSRYYTAGGDRSRWYPIDKERKAARA